MFVRQLCIKNLVSETRKNQVWDKFVLDVETLGYTRRVKSYVYSIEYELFVIDIKTIDYIRHLISLSKKL